MTLSRIDELALTPMDEREIATLLATCFTTDFGGRTAFHQRHHRRYLWREGDALAGHVALAFRHIRQGDRVIPITGLAEVATHPAHRGRGIAGRLVAAAIDDSRASVAAFVTLFGDAPLYTAQGFRPVPNAIRFVDMTGAVTHRIRDSRALEFMVLPTAGQDWDATTPMDLLGHLF
jgi:predicted N-acetyltransferase YhbS